MTIGLNQLLREMACYMPALESARGYAETQYNALPDDVKAQARPRSQSSLMNDFIVTGLRNALSGFREVTTSEKYGQTIVSIQLSNCTANIKCKKVNKRKQISYIPTQLAMGFMENSAYQLSYLDPIMNLIFGFKWNNIRTEIEKIYILHPAGINHFDWECDITRPIEEIPTLPPLTDSTVDKPIGKRVKPKGKYIKSKKKELGDEQ